MALRDLKQLVVECIPNGRDFVNEDAQEAERHRIAKVVESVPDAVALFLTIKLSAVQDPLLRRYG